MQPAKPSLRALTIAKVYQTLISGSSLPALAKLQGSNSLFKTLLPQPVKSHNYAINSALLTLASLPVQINFEISSVCCLQEES